MLIVGDQVSSEFLAPALYMARNSVPNELPICCARDMLKVAAKLGGMGKAVGQRPPRHEASRIEWSAFVPQYYSKRRMETG